MSKDRPDTSSEASAKESPGRLFHIEDVGSLPVDKERTDSDGYVKNWIPIPHYKKPLGLSQPRRSLLDHLARYKTIPAIKDRVQFAHALDAPQVSAVVLQNCNLFEFSILLERAYRRELLSVYVNVDHTDGFSPDSAGLRYLADHFHVAGIISSNPRILALGKGFDLETIQRIFAVDSAGLEVALESIDSRHVDLLDVSPALVIPYLATSFPLPFIASGLLDTPRQVQAVLRAGALGVVVTRVELWQIQQEEIWNSTSNEC